MSWIPVIVIWASLFAVSAYYVREWWRVGRDPKGVAVVPHPVPPEGLSPMGLAFIQRRGAADETAIVTAGMGSLAELVRRGLVRIEESAEGPRIVALEGGDGAGLQPDLLHFFDRMIPRGRAASAGDFRKAAQHQWREVQDLLRARILSQNLGITLSGAALLLMAALATVVLVNWTLPAGNDGSLIFAGLGASLLVFVALALPRRRGGLWFYLALGLGLSGLLVLVIVLVITLTSLDKPAGIERALVLLGLFSTLPVIALAWGAMSALTPEGRRLHDETEGFRQFMRGLDAGQETNPASDTHPERLLPYALALRVDTGWASTLAARLPLQQLLAPPKASAPRPAQPGPA